MEIHYLNLFENPMLSFQAKHGYLPMEELMLACGHLKHFIKTM